MTAPETILQALRDCQTEADVARVSDKYRADVRAMTDKPRQLHILNLKAHRLWEIRNPQ